ncbi:MAG: hypothetical protein ABIW33_09550 [Sphingomicrobium sp.]
MPSTRTKGGLGASGTVAHDATVADAAHINSRLVIIAKILAQLR